MVKQKNIPALGRLYMSTRFWFSVLAVIYLGFVILNVIKTVSNGHFTIDAFGASLAFSALMLALLPVGVLNLTPQLRYFGFQAQALWLILILVWVTEIATVLWLRFKGKFLKYEVIRAVGTVLILFLLLQFLSCSILLFTTHIE